MKGDFTRFTFDPAKHFTRVLKQQGRVDLDADWNEAADIQAYLAATQSKDVIGACGVPKKDPGFLVMAVEADGSDLHLSPGRLYAKGALCATGGTSYKHQPNLPNPPALTPENDRTDLVYLEVWQRHITAAEDPDLLEPALGGADTTTRLKTIWQVKVRKGVSDSDCSGDFDPWPPVPPLNERGRLSTRVSSTTTETNPCLIAAGGGYRGLENRLYRVEIHDGGQPYTWPRPAGVIDVDVTIPANSNYKVTVANWLVERRPWLVGQMVELYSQQTDAAGEAGVQARITAINPGSKTLTLDTNISAMKGHTDLKLRRVATYKWSRDNGSIVFPIQEFVTGENHKVRVKRLGRDQVLTLHPEDWVEVLGDTCELWGIPGTLAAIEPDGIDEAEMKLTLSANVSAHKSEKMPKVRRWDQKSAALPVTLDEVELEDGVLIQFSDTDFQCGDYWCFDARTATGQIDVLNSAPPKGIQRAFCKLAVVHWKENEDWSGTEIEQCSPTFPPLTDIWAEDVFYDNRGCESIQAETVQEAIDQLCNQRHLPYHNKHLHGWGIVCGLQVVCGDEDRRVVVVRPGYALDCEGQDIVLEEPETVSVVELIEKWEAEHPDETRILNNGRGMAWLTIERDANGNPLIGIRPYDQAKETLKARMQGTLLMDLLQDCVLKPIQDLGELFNPPEGEEAEGFVKTRRQQTITLLKLLIQLFLPNHGSHVYLSPKEHAILKKLYAGFTEILQSQTFCGMLDDDQPFPEYPFPRHAISTIFGNNLQHARLRIHPKGKLGYTTGNGPKIGVYNLKREVMIDELEFPGGEGFDVGDVAFSEDGKQLYAVAVANGRDTMFAVADINGVNHTWGAVSMLCGMQLVTLATLPYFSNLVYAVGLGAGLFSIDPGGSPVTANLICDFNAVGHLVVSAELASAYATCCEVDACNNQAGVYNMAKGCNLETGEVRDFILPEKLTGRDDIEIAFRDGGRLFVVADPGQKQQNKSLFVFDALKTNILANINLEENTEIRLQYLPHTRALVLSYADNFWLRLVDIQEPGLLKDFFLPVQISPIALAYDPILEEKPPSSAEDPAGSPRFYVWNGLSTTLTTIPSVYLVPSLQVGVAPRPGGQEFMNALVEYRNQILQAFLQLIGNSLQTIKDCFCQHLLIDCPECDEEDDVYLGAVRIRDSQVFQICNFSPRKYVKSFPTVGYWLSLIPLSPLVDMFVQKLCCMILPDFFNPQGLGGLAAVGKQANMNMKMMRNVGAFVQAKKYQAVYKQGVSPLKTAGQVTGEWVGKTVERTVAPRQAGIKHMEVAGSPVEQATERMKDADVNVVRIEKYDPSQGMRNLSRIGQAPLNLQAGARVVLYEQDGVVRYYGLAEEPPAAVAELHKEVETQKAALAEVATLRTELSDLQTSLTRKDEELNILREKMTSLERAAAKKQPSTTRITQMENELKELRTFREEMKLFMERKDK